MRSFSICSFNASKVYLMKKKWCIWQLNKSNLCQWYQAISLVYIKRNGSTFPHIINETYTESPLFHFCNNFGRLEIRKLLGLLTKLLQEDSFRNNFNPGSPGCPATTESLVINPLETVYYKRVHNRKFISEIILTSVQMRQIFVLRRCSLW